MDSEASYLTQRLSTGIDIARICTMFLIVSGHYMQLNGFYGQFTNGASYPFQPGDYNNYLTSLESQQWLFDKIFLGANFNYWSLNFTFYALSGLSLWFSTKKRTTFSLKDYFYTRFFGVYTGYLIAATAAFIIGVVFLNHNPGEHDLNYLILGVTRAHETLFYNDTLWFMSVLFVLYLIYPIIPLAYSKLGTTSIIALCSCSYYFFEMKHVFADISFIPTGITYFVIGITTCEILSLVPSSISWKYKKTTLLSVTGIAFLAAQQILATSHWHILKIKQFGYDTHYSGLMYFALFISAGMLAPATRSAALRALANATYPVYLFHYLVVRLFNNNEQFHVIICNAVEPFSFPLTRSIFVTSCLIFAFFLGFGLLYNTYFMAPLTRLVRKCFDREIVLARTTENIR